MSRYTRSIRKNWLDLSKQGESAYHIALEAGTDPRTVKRGIEKELRVMAVEDARKEMIVQALQKHQNDLKNFASKIKKQLGTEKADCFTELKKDVLWSALRQHLPRNRLWRGIKRWEKSLATEKDVARMNDELNLILHRVVITGQCKCCPY